MLITNVSKILDEENIFSHSEFTTLNRIDLIKIVLFRRPKLSKNSSLRLYKQVYLFLSKHPLF